MKNKASNFLTVILIVFSYLLFSYTTDPKPNIERVLNSDIIDIPENVRSIIDNKCINCHSTESKSQKSKMKMNFDKFTNGKYSNSKLVSKFGKITKELNKNDMPPEKYLAKNPDKTLTKEESELLISWATKQRKILSGE